jgi:hypothetical protein
VGFASLENVALGFSWEKHQDFSHAQTNLYQDVMLETKTEMIWKLEQGFEPWKVAEAPTQSL